MNSKYSKAKRFVFLICFFILLTQNIKHIMAEEIKEYDDIVILNLEKFIPDENFNPEKDIIISENELNITKIKILPTDSTYFLNTLKNYIKNIFTINKLDEISTQKKQSSQYLKEFEKCIEIGEKNEQFPQEKCAKKAIQNYEKTKQNLYNNLKSLEEKNKVFKISEIIELEINHNLILRNIEKYKDIKNLEKNNLENLGQFLKTIKNEVELKKGIISGINNQNLNKTKLNFININNFIEKIKPSTNSSVRDIIDQIINENQVQIIKNLNDSKITNIEKNLQYYFFKTYNNNFNQQIKTIDDLYKLQSSVQDSPIKDLVKISILNTKQIPISLLNSKLINLDTQNLDKSLNEILIGSDINKLNTISLVKKYTQIGGIINLKLGELEQLNLNNIYKKIDSIVDAEQKQKIIINTLESISGENYEIIEAIIDKTKIKEVQTAYILNSLEKIEENLNLIKKQIQESVCPENYEPVCAENNMTYDNICFAEKVGVKIIHNGECKIVENQDLPKITDQELEKGWYFGTKSQKKPGTPATWILINQGTKSSKWIDPKKNVNNLKPIEEKEIICTMEFDPVCGSDGKTYSNKCFAQRAGVEVKSSGMCGE